MSGWLDKYSPNTIVYNEGEAPSPWGYNLPNEYVIQRNWKRKIINGEPSTTGTFVNDTIGMRYNPGVLDLNTRKITTKKPLNLNKEETAKAFQTGGQLNFLQPNDSKLPVGYKIPNKYPSTELAMSIGGEEGEPAYLIPSFKYGQPLSNPLKEFKETGDYLGGPFKTWQEADKWEKEIRHPYVEKGQSLPSPLKWWGEGFQNGGQLEAIRDAANVAPYYLSGYLERIENEINPQSLKEISPDILARQAYKESGFNTKAYNKSGAKGHAQLKDDVINSYIKAHSLAPNSISPSNPQQASNVQKWYMDSLYNSDFINKPNQRDDIRIAKTLAAYNWGRGNLSNKLEKLKQEGYDIYNDVKWIEKLPRETSDYINKILYNKDEEFNKNYNKAFNKNLPLLKTYTEFQNGGELKYYQEGDDFQPKMISKNGIKIDNNGYWNPDNWGKPIQINSNDITMEGVYEPLDAFAASGEHITMYPGNNYHFKKGPVVEVPTHQNWADKY